MLASHTAKDATHTEDSFSHTGIKVRTSRLAELKDVNAQQHQGSHDSFDPQLASAVIDADSVACQLYSRGDMRVLVRHGTRACISPLAMARISGTT